MYDNRTYEEQIKDLYLEFNEKKERGEKVDKNVYRIRKRLLEIAIEKRDEGVTL